MMTRTVLCSVVAVIQLIAGAVLWCGTSAAQPANDNFADAETIVGNAGQVDGSNVDATTEPNEPSFLGMFGKSIWYKWVAPANLCLNVDTIGSSFDTALCVFTGTTLNNLQIAACNDDIPMSGNRSMVVFPALAGTTYYFQVRGFAGEGSAQAGSVHLNWTFAGSGPSNDNLAAAQSIGGTAGRVTGSTVTATLECGEPNHGDGAERTVWYRWVTPSSFPVTFTTDFSDYDTILAVYTGDSLAALTLVVSDDDNTTSASSLLSSVMFNATAGTAYDIAVAGFGLFGGNLSLNWAATPPNDNFADALMLNGASGTIAGNTLGATKETGEPSGDEGRSVWFVWQAPATNLVIFNTSGSSFSTQLAAYTGTSINTLTGTQVASGLSAIQFLATSGTRYRISLEGLDDTAVGAFILNWASPPGVPTLTPTPTPIASENPPSPSPTRTPLPCQGDCNLDNKVASDDLLTLVSIALGDTLLSDCPHGDANSDGKIAIDEILSAMNTALHDCPI